MREIFYELIREAKDAKVILDGDEWPIGFNSDIEGRRSINSRNLSTLVVKNEEEFLEYLEKYINLELYVNRKHMMFSNNPKRNHIKSLMAYLFINMSTEDFLNPIDCLRRRIDFLKDTTFSLYDESIDFKAIPGSELRMKQSSSSIYMETPYVMNFSIEQDDEIVHLPCISYGICEENGEKVCYIYSIMNHVDRVHGDESRLSKKVNRLMYKMNKGVSEYEKKQKDVEDSLTDVTPSFVFVLITFLTMLQSKGITMVKAVPYLPVRYLSRSIAAENVNDLNIRKIREERNNRIQRNATEKFIRTFRRAAYHMDGAEIIGYPYELDENLTMELHSKGINNELLEDVQSEILGR